MFSPPRSEPSSVLQETGIIAVLRARHAREYLPVVEALLKGGIRSIELTLSTEGVFAELPRLKSAFGETVELGTGTVTSVDEARKAVEAGAEYIVTPITDQATTEFAVSRGLPVYPGGLTPSELYSSWVAGATAVKIFPASLVGPGYLSHLRGPFPDLKVIPSGGVALEEVPAWISAGATAVSLGGPLLGDAFAGGDLKLLTKRAKLAIDLARKGM